MDIFVYPNPLVALDGKGWPCGRAFVSPGHPRPYDVLGGKLRREVVKHDEGREQKKSSDSGLRDVREARVRVHADVRMRKLRVPLDQYIRERVASGDLIAADKQSAMACGIAGQDFRPAIDVLREELRARLREWKAQHDPDDAPALAGCSLALGDGDEIVLVPPAPTPS